MKYGLTDRSYQKIKEVIRRRIYGKEKNFNRR